MPGADLTLVEQFLNTLDTRTFTWHGRKQVPTDQLTSPEALAAWLEDHDLLPKNHHLGPSDLTTALTLRAALRAALTDADDTKAVQALQNFPLHLAPDPDGHLRLTATSEVPGLNVIVETVATSVAASGWHRLKLCSSPECRWAFYDTSRNGGGRWCRMAACGNRTKTRAYRARTNADQDAS